MDSYNTPAYNSKMLKVIFGGYVLVAALSCLFAIFQNEVFHLNHILSMSFSYSMKLISIFLVGWAAIAGKRFGINALGRVGAWVTFFSLLLINGIIIYRQFLFMDIDFDYHESMTILNILNIITTSLGFIISAGLTLMAIGSKLKIFPMIAFAATIWAADILGLAYMFLGYTYFLTYLISELVIYTATGIIILRTPTRE
ncbi:MAG: hypothetical protein K2N28_00055 [Muribaculaceae bacterium]|nr:hypothetical protein [Muribaculaceae bacterium]